MLRVSELVVFIGNWGRFDNAVIFNLTSQHWRYQNDGYGTIG